MINSTRPLPHGSSDQVDLAAALVAALPGPPWHVSVRPDGEACCQRTYEYFVETVHIADGLHVGANRRPIDGRAGPAIRAESFAGTLRAAIRFLATPPRWEGEA
ncbi:hypothetical protein [Actinophytocola algeriensis]|uniref:Uncharacterized protein n=1 Tax=Actinophytocola algeriensis TaxID=1768010 RepID=A0A7W7Q274_9PSEU|nr:hypothetical protein [Actinophytocola algeriensis]MBB4905601.1 hypothetical protein [Actinophytocola algeriensis]MBE1472714.1 hypothetical protein [Actinophytocola algeriensis]